MTVHFIRVYDQMAEALKVPTGDTLFGKPFPPDDVKAYWSLVPESIEVEWLTALGVFFVTRMRPVNEEYQPTVRQQIMASDAHKLAVWMKVISELCCGQSS